ncbi:HdaA/DnaA family protein [Parasphingopyxis marina]|uniref:Chromosomal replication initiator DnaA n=1 Tax=Parasphingopyxis marina TaxID=2761622 RepID=A0A842HZN3_9SPHN|nr:chromosomal replication initiator DnaA [Parasphingopyxis marina]MBC2777883.1 chromosomal replication initiator DnaA [Parasphingopyxis marina]
MSQFALPLALPEDGGDNAFIVDASNSEALRHLGHWQHWPVPAALLTGPRKSGRSSLGRLFAGRTGGTVIDDADLSDEESLFHAWNAAQSSKIPLLIIADEPPPRWKIALPDLRTRIAATPKIQIEEPGDALIEQRLHRHFGAEGLAVPQNAIDYLLKRMERSHYALHQLIETIDRMAFERQSRISLGLVRDAMNALGFIDV